MGITFDVDEVFEIAEQIERNGAEFYRRAAQRMSSQEVSVRLLKLSKWEEEHEETFRRMRARAAEQRGRTASWDPEGEAARYLRAMASGHVFELQPDFDEIFAGSETELDLLHVAIGFEKDSIVYYLGIREAIPPQQGKEEIEGIIRQEMDHITTLSGDIAAIMS